jgi:hypothetical protein
MSEARSVTAKFDFIGTLQTVELQPGPEEAMDTQISFGEGNTIGSHGDYNFGKFTAFGIGCYDHSTITRVLMRFDLPSSIKVERIVSAQLDLTPSAWVQKAPGGPLTVYVYKMLKSWKQGTAVDHYTQNSATVDGATGRERYFGADWSTIGAGQEGVDVSGSYASSVAKTYDASSPDLSPWAFDVTTYVKDWANDPASNYGFLLKSNEYLPAGADSYSYPQFHSGESTDANSRPKLSVTYKP